MGEHATSRSTSKARMPPGSEPHAAPSLCSGECIALLSDPQ